METAAFLRLREKLMQTPEYKAEIEWQESLQPCDSPTAFLIEYVWVVIHAGMSNKAARSVMDKFSQHFDANVIRHEGKRKAVLTVMSHITEVWGQYCLAEDKLAYLETLPWIGPITKYHLAKNLGMDCMKPDRHLVRLAQQYKTTPVALCQKLAKETGFRVATVDLVLWRAANLKMI